MCRNGGQECLTLKITPEDKYWIFRHLRFVIKLEHRVSNITQLTCTKLPQVYSQLPVVQTSCKNLKSKQEVLVAKCSFVNIVNCYFWISARFHHRSFKIDAEELIKNDDD